MIKSITKTRATKFVNQQSSKFIEHYITQVDDERFIHDVEEFIQGLMEYLPKEEMILFLNWLNEHYKEVEE